MTADAAAELAREIGAAAKYRGVAMATIEDIVSRELQRAASTDEARQRARKRLHEVAARYLGTPRLSAAKRTLDNAFDNARPGAVEGACRTLLGLHASTRERLPLLAELYRGIFTRTGTPRVVCDLAAALGPLAYRFMGLPRETRYVAYDIQRDFVELLAHYFALEGLNASAVQRDVLVDPPAEPADVALLLKMYHCLEKRRPGAGLEVIASTPARHVVVSLPTHTIGGRRAPFVEAHFGHIRTAASAAGWSLDGDSLQGEAYLVIDKGAL